MTGPRRYRLLDLFCCAGGAAMGYARAGFEVVGVDIRPQPRYPFEFVRADATTFPLDGFDAVHGSPPCHDHGPLRARSGLNGTGWMLPATRARLTEWGGVWVIENVPGAEMRADLMLCGGMFGLRTYRHRWFEFGPAVALLDQPAHPRHRVRACTKKRRAGWDAGLHMSVTGNVGSYVGSRALGIDWMTGAELSQAIPPAYTHHIGTQLIAALDRRIGDAA